MTDTQDTGLGHKTSPAYIDAAMQTANVELHPFETFSHRQLYHGLVAVSDAAKVMNGIKKALVYGRELPEDSPLHNCPNISQATFNDVPVPILHGCVGVITEAGELADFLLAAIFGRDDIDIPNLREEMGDIQWYQARIARFLGDDFEGWQASNIAKLTERHLKHTGGFNPNTATEEGRDREAEQAAADAVNTVRPVSLEHVHEPSVKD